MLTFTEKLELIERSFPELKRKDVSLGRINFHYEESVIDKQVVVYHLHPNGNGFVYAEQIDGNFALDHKGMVNIREYSVEELSEIIRQSIDSLSESNEVPTEEIWVNQDNHQLKLVDEGDIWMIYAGDSLDGTFPTYKGAASYLEQEGFNPL